MHREYTAVDILYFESQSEMFCVVGTVSTQGDQYLQSDLQNNGLNSKQYPVYFLKFTCTMS